MKILYISQSVIPSKSANSIHAMKMCSALSKLNNSVDLFCWNKSNEIEKDVKNFYKFYSVKNNFKIIRLKIFNVWILKELLTFFFILFRILFYKYDLIYSRNIQLSWFLSILGVKTILEIHSPPSIKTNFLLKILLKKGSLKLLILINKALKNHILKNYEVHRYLELIVLPDAADTQNFTQSIVRKKFNIKKNSIGYLGHLYQGRGIDLIIKLAKEFPQNNFYIVGGSEHHVNVWRKNLNLINIFFLGFQNQNNCNILRQQFDCLIAPYQNKVYVHGAILENKEKKSKLETSKWMSPLKLFEYMEAKKPIITSNLSAIREILINEVDAILCDPNDFNQWKNAIQKLNKDAALRKRISINAYNKFLKNFTWNLRAKNLLNRYYASIKQKNVTFFNFSLIGGGTEYMLSVLFNQLVRRKQHNLNMLTCVNYGHYFEKIQDKTKLFTLNKQRVILSIFSIVNFLKKNNSNILFTSMTHTNLIAILIKIFFIPKIKVIIRESNTISVKAKETLGVKTFILDQMVRIFYNYADKIVAPTKVIKNDLIKNYRVKKEKIIIIVNPYDFDEIYSKSKEVIEKKEKKFFKNPFILSVGRLNPQKNYKFLIKIFKHIIINKKFKNFRLYILGEGRDKIKLKQFINDQNLKKKIFLLGFQKNPFKFMKKCKLFILSSKYEGHSNVLVHSQILNNKILASKAYGANKEVLKNNGDVFINNNPSLIANQAIKLMRNKKRNINKEMLVRRFSHEKVASRFNELF